MTRPTVQTSAPDLPRYGIGAAPLGNLYSEVTDRTAHETLAAAGDTGLSLIDTAPFYGHGLSEQRVGKYLATLENRPAISTKVGRVLKPAGTAAIPDNGFASPAPFIPEFDYSASGIRQSFRDSTKRLGVDTVDILLLHDIGEATHAGRHEAVLTQALDEAIPELAALKDEGKTRWIGLGVNEIHVCQRVLEVVDLDVLLIAGRYTLLEHENALPFLDECNDRGVKVIIGGAFNSGLLAATGDDPLYYNYDVAPVWAVKAAADLRETCARFDVPLPAAALQFCSAHPAVATVIPGARSPSQVRQIAEWTGLKIDPRLWDELKVRKMICETAPVPA